ncbi:MAG: hypothetical protein AB1405_11230, partial [Bdellovibrionota bacterium]
KALRDMIPDKTLLTDEDLKKYRDNICLPGRITPMLNYYRAMIRYDLAKQSRKKLPIIETPTLFLWGEKDVALGKELTYGTDRYVKDLTLRYLPGISHLAQQHAPNLVNPMIEAFLTNHPVPEARDLEGVVASSPSPELREGL